MTILRVVFLIGCKMIVNFYAQGTLHYTDYVISLAFFKDVSLTGKKRIEIFVTLEVPDINMEQFLADNR